MEVQAHEETGRKRGRMSGGTTAARVVARKEAERERRQHMKDLCAKLASLIPKEHFSNPDTMTQLGRLDKATSYIKKLKERVDELQHRRSSVQAMAAERGTSGASTYTTTPTMSGCAGSPEGKNIGRHRCRWWRSGNTVIQAWMWCWYAVHKGRSCSMR